MAQTADTGIIARAGLRAPWLAHATADLATSRIDLGAGRIDLPPWSFAWIMGT